MLQTERDPQGNGRTSRASNMSASSRGFHNGPVPGGRPDLLSSAAYGVMGMLRTSTEVGDIGGVPYESSLNMPNVPLAPRRNGASSRMSTGSSHSTASRRTSAQQAKHQIRPSSSSGPRQSMTKNQNVPQYQPDTLSPTMLNLPGTSPLVPFARNSRDGGRSRSMTHHTSQPHLGLTNNRSYSSLQGYDRSQRPRSPFDPYMTSYPRNLLRPGTRPVSPASTYSDYADMQPRAPYGNTAYSRVRVPSDNSLHRTQRGHMKPPVRSKSPAYHVPRHGQSGIPPMPAVPQQYYGDLARVAPRSTKASVSSFSTNVRTDSDPPSSDGPSPPTPKDGVQTGLLPNLTGSQVVGSNPRGVVKVTVPENTLYYDGSEEYYERDGYTIADTDAIPMPFGYEIKTIAEELTPFETPHDVEVVVAQEHVEPRVYDPEDRAELPASPVPRRLTRDLVRELVGDQPSTTEEVDISNLSLNGKNSDEVAIKEYEQQQAVGLAKGVSMTEVAQPKGSNEHRCSSLSQAMTSLMDSSTVEVAVRFDCNSAATATNTTEDGMSDLLDGYQHTETKEDVGATEKTSIPDGAAEHKRSHTPKSSDEQSFKSCPDLRDQPNKDLDARSFKTCKDTMTPDRVMSMPPSSLPSWSVKKNDTELKRPLSEIPPSKPAPNVLRKQPPVPPRESSFSKVTSRMRANSRLSSRHGSTVTSVPSSLEGSAQQQLNIPPRDSSSSKEAQNHKEATSFLLKSTKALSMLGKKPAKIEPVDQPGLSSNVVKAEVLQNEVHYPFKRPMPTEETAEVVQSPKKTLAKQGVVFDKLAVGATSSPGPGSKQLTPSRTGSAGAAQSMHHHHSLSTPSPIIAEPSSIYSPGTISFSSKSHTSSSPADLPRSPEHGRRNSQTTTHLDWNGTGTSPQPPTNAMRARVFHSNRQDETTTDLRFSGYRQAANRLPDVQEESHEDSNLNNSPSNPKSSNFSSPVGGRHSFLDETPCVRRSSVQTFRIPNVDVEQTMGKGFLDKTQHDVMRQQGMNSTHDLPLVGRLPSMNFSSMDLVGNVNQLLDLRSSRSFDGTDAVPEERDNGRLQMSTSEGGMREKYKSLFAGLEGSEKTQVAAEPAIDLISVKRRFHVNGIIGDVKNVDIPSVDGLTERISGFLPWRDGTKDDGTVQFPEEEEIMEHAMVEIQGVGGPVPKRSSARLRPIPGSPHMVVVDDAVYEEWTGGEKEDAAVGIESNEQAGINAGRRNLRDITGLECLLPVRVGSSRSVHTPSGKSPGSPMGPKRTAANPWQDQEHPPEKVYNWADIDLHAQKVSRVSPRRELPPPRPRLSESSSGASTLSPHHNKQATSPSAIDLYTRAQYHNNNRLCSSTHLDTLPTPGLDASGYPTGPITVRGSDHSHEAGDRYPTSSLSPPSNVNIQEIAQQQHSHLSDSEDEAATGRKRRFTLRRRAISASQPPEMSEIKVSHPDGPSSFFASMQESAEEGRDLEANPRRQTYRGVQGMSNADYLKGRFVKKWNGMIRNIGKKWRKVFPKKNNRNQGMKYHNPTAGHRVVTP